MPDANRPPRRRGLLALILLGVAVTGGGAAVLVAWATRTDPPPLEEAVAAAAQAMIRDLNGWLLPSGGHPQIGARPRLLLSRVGNATPDSIDMSQVMDVIRNGLIRGGQVRFAVDGERRVEFLDEVEYMESGAVDPLEVTRFAREHGIDVVLSGELSSSSREREGRTAHRLTLLLERVTSDGSEMVWIDERELPAPPSAWPAWLPGGG